MVAAILSAVLAIPNAVGQSSDARTDEVHHLQETFLKVLRQKHTTQFLSYIGKGGVAFGVDANVQSRKQIANEFHTHDGAYCFLFDSTCLTREWNASTRRGGRANRFCSVYELLTASKSAQVETSLGSHHGKPQAYVWITPGVQSCSNGSVPVEFIFTRFDDGWKLVAAPFS